MNSELFRKIADVIEAEPGCHDQRRFSSTCDDDAPFDAEFVTTETIHTCGTKACIAGWAVHLTPKEDRPESESIMECAAKLLGLSDSEADTLFDGDWSPREGVTIPQELRRIADQQSIGGTATAGENGTATAGHRGTATAGENGTATAGDYGTATAGYAGTATAGDYGTATAGYAGTATAGYAGTATAGENGTATAGDYGTATAGENGTATAGENGVIVIFRWKDGNRIPTAGVIGESLDSTLNLLKPNTAYKLNDHCKFVEAVKS